MRKQILLAVLGLLLVVGLVAAYKGDINVKGPNYSEERHLAMTEAFETGDYLAWKELMTQDGREPGVLRFVTEENFEEFAKTHGEGIRADNGEGRMGQGSKGSKKGIGLHDGTGSGRGSGLRDGSGGNTDCPYV